MSGRKKDGTCSKPVGRKSDGTVYAWEKEQIVSQIVSFTRKIIYATKINYYMGIEPGLICILYLCYRFKMLVYEAYVIL